MLLPGRRVLGGGSPPVGQPLAGLQVALVSSKSLSEHAAVLPLMQCPLNKGGVQRKLRVHQLHALPVEVARLKCSGCMGEGIGG